MNVWIYVGRDLSSQAKYFPELSNLFFKSFHNSFRCFKIWDSSEAEDESENKMSVDKEDQEKNKETCNLISILLWKVDRWVKCGNWTYYFSFFKQIVAVWSERSNPHLESEKQKEKSESSRNPEENMLTRNEHENH